MKHRFSRALFAKAVRAVLLLMFCPEIVPAQTWKAMMYDPGVNLYDVVREAELYFQTVDKNARGSGWKTYQRWLYENEPKYYPSGDRSKVDPYFVSNAYRGFLKNNPSAKIPLFGSGWEELGPYYIGQVTGHYSLGLGRVEAFHFDPGDPLRIYLGSRSGGFWRTLDGGATWTGSTTDTLIATGVNTLAASPSNPDSVLINVRNSRNNTTHGIYRSADGGDTWAATNFIPANLGWGGLGTNNAIHQVVYHPTVPHLVFVATSEGLYRSADDLTTWTIPIPVTTVYQVEFHPADPNIVYVRETNDSFIHISTDGGNTFGTSNTIPGSIATMRLSVTAACPNCVYAGSSDGVWRSVDNGMNFTLVSTPGLSLYGAFAVSDVDTSYLLFGNIDVNMSADGGQTFSKTTTWSQGNANYATNPSYVHADIRIARCIGGVFWVGTDGFLARSADNGITWQRFEGVSIRENYSLGLSQSNHERTICGSQDNGTSIKTENSWVEFYGADGMEGIIHPLNDDWMIGSLQNGGRRRTKDGGLTQGGVTPPGQTGSWIAPLYYDPNDQMRVYSIGDSIYRSDDFGSNWTKLGTPNFSGTISYAVIAENNSNIMVVTKGSAIDKSLDGGNTFINIKGTLPNSSITDVAFDPNDDQVIVVTYGSYLNDNQKVFITTNQAQTWQNITYNLNNLPVRSVVIDHTDASTIYLGTEIGVFKKAMTGTSWTLYSQGLPNMSVLELEVMYGSNTLRAATWGRGLWEFTLDGRQGFPAVLTTRISNPPTDIKPGVGADQYVTSVISYDSTVTGAYVEWSVNAPVFGNVIPMTNTVDSTWVSNSPLPNPPVGSKVYFKVFAVGSQGDTTETYKFMYEVRPFEYCPSYGSMTFATAVTLVDFNTINNPTGKTQPYTDYTASDSTVLETGNTYKLSVNLDTDGNNTVFAMAWIDWNHDGDFEDPGEDYDLGTAVNTPNGATGLSPLGIAVPLTAKVGTTVMRVSAKKNAAPSPCETGFNGEVEDYSIVIISSVGIVENTFGYAPRVYPNPTGGSFFIDLGARFESTTVTVSDLNGRRLHAAVYEDRRLLNLALEEPAGVYLVSIESGDRSAVIRLVKE